MGSQGGSQPQQDQRSLPPLLPHGRSFFSHLISMKWQYVVNKGDNDDIRHWTFEKVWQKACNSDRRCVAWNFFYSRIANDSASRCFLYDDRVSKLSFGSMNIKLPCCRLILQNKNHCGTLWSFGFVMSIQQCCSALPCPLFLLWRFEDV